MIKIYTANKLEINFSGTEERWIDLADKVPDDGLVKLSELAADLGLMVVTTVGDRAHIANMSQTVTTLPANFELGQLFKLQPYVYPEEHKNRKPVKKQQPAPKKEGLSQAGVTAG